MDPKDERDEPLREEDVTVADRLDDRVAEADGLADDGESPDASGGSS